MRLIIAGSRNFHDYDLLKSKLDYFLANVLIPIEIVSGTANGADKLGEKYAAEKGLAVKQFPADWDKHGKKAGYLRNKQLAEYATHCVCFWDGKSNGTKIMIELCKKLNIPCRVVFFQ